MNMPNEASQVDVLGDVIRPNDPALSLDSDFEQPAPAKPPKPAEQGDSDTGGEEVVELDDVSVDELREIITEHKANKAAVGFVQDHRQDYTPTPANYAKIQQFLDENNLPFNRENLETAFEQLQDQFETRASAPKPAAHKSSSSGISDTVNVGPEPHPQTAVEIEAEARRLPMHELRAKIQNRAFKAGKFGPRVQRATTSHTPIDEGI
jgi:hypothetical protein